MPSPDSRDSLTSRRCFPTIRAFSEFPGSSVVERRTVNPLVGGSNPSRGANFQRSIPVKSLPFLTGGHTTEIDLAPAKAQAAALGHGDGHIVERVMQLRQAGIRARRGCVEL